MPTPLLEISVHEADGGELVGPQAIRRAFGNPLPLLRGKKSPEGHSGAVPRLLLWQRKRGAQVRRGRLP
jgi:hypothetical protein